ncbi:protein EI24 homolog isoform X1 [Solanum verrucosum]|uniref:protein EI24 homolog isoform X1 n=2 Tax=Solanum verrucosum TaxID=315347 RepID=UPI0020D0AF2B|nr:protein EI24 homolog isoform X1 [Solanum verrucosum]
MESMGPLVERVQSKSKQALLQWVDGVREACCLHRVIIYSLRSKQLAIRTGQCFLLNGFIFLGSILVLKSVIIPSLEWILPGHCRLINSQQPCSFSNILEFYRFLRVGLVQLFYVFWFYPLYIFSLILSNIWYIDIAKYGFFALENYGDRDTKLSDQKEPQTSQNTVHREKPTDLEGVMISIAEQLYSVLLLTFFFMEVYVTGFIPYIGKALNFMLLSWLYAYYCFEYKWNLSGLSLDKRLDFFESNWAFFAGFGNPCVLAIFLFSPLVSCGVMAMLFPLFVLTATGSEADKIVALPRRKWRGAELGRVPIFFVADYMSMRVLKLFSLKSHHQIKENKAL